MNDGIYFDGAADPNRVTLASDSHTYHTVVKLHSNVDVSNVTNNVSEYNALLQAHLYCNVNSLKNVNVFGDSKLVIMQTLGKYSWVSL